MFGKEGKGGKRREMKRSHVISLVWILREERKQWKHNLLGPPLAIRPIWVNLKGK